MVDRPIIFSAPMVRALLDGRKTMTRRLAEQIRKTHPSNTSYDTYQLPSPWQKAKPGDRLWVRENWRVPGDCSAELESTSTCTGPDDCEFAADFAGMELDLRRWRPSIHMPRWASRLTLLVEAVKIERLQEISEADAEAEGVRAIAARPDAHALTVFSGLWETLHGPGSWHANPEVVALSFLVEKRNIDQLGAAP